MHGDHGSINLTSTELSGSPMAAIPDDQQAWIPYETTKDCTLGFCSIYCPQWCYIIFPPPPPLAGDASPSTAAASSAFSPLVIAIIGILASAFLLVSYYTIVSKYCARFDPLRRRARHIPSSGGPEDPPSPEAAAASSWHAFPSNGLDEALISKIAVYKYQHGEGVVDGTDCSVCLGEFMDDESLRLLPKCSHAFHLQCIDTWLRSHSNCPLCRANIVAAAAAAPPPPPPPLPEPPAQTNDLPINLEDVDIGIEEEDGDLEGEFGADSSKESPNYVIEIGDGDGDGYGDGSSAPIRRCSSVGSWRHDGRVSIADVLRISMEEEFLVAKDQGLWVGAGTSRRCGVEHGKGNGRSRSLHCVISPVSMKRSFSSGRFCFSSSVQGRGRNAVLPI